MSRHGLTTAIALALAFATALPLVAGAQASLDEVDWSPDITIPPTGVTVDDEDVVTDDFALPVVPAALGALPSNVDVIGYALLPLGDQLFTVDTTVALGAFTAERGDVIRYDGVSYSVEFDASANGVPASAMTDAVTEDADGDLFISFDTTVALPGPLTVDDEDLVRWDGAVYSMEIDGSVAGVPTALDLDAAYALFNSGRFLVSFDGSGAVGAVPAFDDEDLLEYDPLGPTWVMSYDGDVNHASLASTDIDATDAALADSDLDGILDDGDGSGTPGDGPCSCTSPGVPVGCDVACDDNCRYRPNTTQLDRGGINSPQYTPGNGTPDLIGDVCQCGDMNADGVVNTGDVVLYRRKFAPLPSPFSTDLCSVVGLGASAGVCDIADLTIMRRTFAGLTVGIVTQVCPPELGIPDPMAP